MIVGSVIEVHFEPWNINHWIILGAATGVAKNSLRLRDLVTNNQQIYVVSCRVLKR